MSENCNSPEEEVVEIDGSFGEGGGQIIRNGVALACLLRRKIELTNIRANRPNPGLASQHLESILGLLQISGGKTGSSLRKGVTEFVLDGTPIPTSVDGVTTTIDLKTAGSVTLCIQCILPFLLTLKSPSKIRIIGGTHTMKAPNFDYMQRVFVPILTKFLGYNISVELHRPGYFPRGGGCVELSVTPSASFNPFQLTERGKLAETHAILNLTPKLMQHCQKFKNMISDDTRSIEVRTVSYASVEYFSRFDSGYVAGFYDLPEGRNPSYDQIIESIKKVRRDYKYFMESPGAAVDYFMQDQLIIYMALAKLSNVNNVSTMKTVTLTDHTLSAIHVSEILTPNIFRYKKERENSADLTHLITL